MKILQIAVGEAFKGGGVGRIASRIAEELPSFGIKSSLASCSMALSKRNYKFFSIKCFQFPFFSSVVFPFNIESIIKREKPDVVISHGYASTLPIFSYFISKKYKIKHVFGIHSYPVEKGLRKLALGFYDIMAKPVLDGSKIIYFSHSSKRFLKRSGEVFKFVPEKRFFVKKGKGRYLLFVGRLDENKRAELFIKLCKRLREKAFIAGIDEGKRRDIIKLADRLGVDLDIKEVPLEKMPEVYSNAKALVMTSKYEGLPLVWYEAIAASLPVFTTNVGDAKEFFSGLGLDYRDFVFETIEEAEEKIKKAFSDIQMLNEKMRLAKEKLKKTSWRDTVKHLVEYISSDQHGKI